MEFQTESRQMRLKATTEVRLGAEHAQTKQGSGTRASLWHAKGKNNHCGRYGIWSRYESLLRLSL